MDDPRQPHAAGPAAEAAGWLVLSDDDLVFCIESLPSDHAEDDQLVAVVKSDRHFFVRQEAAKKIRDADRLKAFAGDRHIGQILVRQMRREGDVTYLEQLLRESRHLEVRNAATVQLRQLRETLARRNVPGKPGA
jgi:hypothetical protein